MPVFEYKCNECGRITELLESGNARNAKKCSHCGSSNLTKQISVFAAQVRAGQPKKCFGCSDQSCPHSSH